MPSLFNRTYLIEDFAELLNTDYEEIFDIECDNSYEECIDIFVEESYWSDLEENYISQTNGEDVDSIILFFYIRERDEDILDYVTEYMINKKHNYCYIREKLIKMCLYIKLREDKEEVIYKYKEMIEEKKMMIIK